MADRHTVRDRSTVKPQGEDADFLIEEFGVSENEAGELVARDGITPEEVTAAGRKERAGRDRLEGVPTPEPGPDYVADSDEVARKPVVNRTNERSGGG